MDKSKVFKRLGEIQKALKAPKSQHNSFGNYNYRNCEDILEAVKPLLQAEECVILGDEVVMIGGRYYVKATASLYAGDAIMVEASAYARESEDKKGMDAAQITGAASSYARKYALNGLFAIDDTKDADSDKPSPSKEIPKDPTDEWPIQSGATSVTGGDNHCELHNRDMKERKTPTGGVFYDHRMQIDGVWNMCDGTGYKAQK